MTKGASSPRESRVTLLEEGEGFLSLLIHLFAANTTYFSELMSDNTITHFVVLFTAQKTKKFKTWQDGKVKSKYTV